VEEQVQDDFINFMQKFWLMRKTMMLAECNTWQHECKVTLLTSSAKEEKHEAARI